MAQISSKKMRLANSPKTEKDIIRQDEKEAPVVKHTKYKEQRGKKKADENQKNAYPAYRHRI